LRPIWIRGKTKRLPFFEVFAMVKFLAKHAAPKAENVKIVIKAMSMHFFIPSPP
jgi:hypothetical protein